MVELMLLFILKQHNGGFQSIEASMQNITIVSSKIIQFRDLLFNVNKLK